MEQAGKDLLAVMKSTKASIYDDSTRPILLLNYPVIGYVLGLLDPASQTVSTHMLYANLAVLLRYYNFLPQILKKVGIVPRSFK